MCGIIGVFNSQSAGSKVNKGLQILRNRGRDGFGIADESSFYFSKTFTSLPVLKSNHVIGHCLHAVVGVVKQPIDKKFAANCEIYNWLELKGKYKINASNDAELMLRMIERKGISAVEEFDGVYAFVFWNGNEVILGRDILGEKPVWYSHADGFAFASEKKALEAIGCYDVLELNPRKFLRYSIREDRIDFIERSFFSIAHEMKFPMSKIEKALEKLLFQAVRKRVPNKKFGLLFSGGVDSTFLAVLLKKMGYDFTCYTAACVQEGLKAPEDLVYAKEVAKALGLRLKVSTLAVSRVPALLKKIVPLIEDTNVTKVCVALPFFVACKQASKDGCKVIFSGLGSEEIFAGYQRHKNSADINKECLSGLLKLYERDLYRDDVVTMHNNLELRLPFLDKELVSYALRIPAEYKLKGDSDKIVFRKVAENAGLAPGFSQRKKRAAQYGSNFLKAVDKLAKKNGLSSKSAYLRAFYTKHNLRLGVLFSGGKDSAYALYVMQRQNYKIDCLISLVSENPDSYMFHTPNMGMVRLQSEAIGLPLIEQLTKGTEEIELEDLERALSKAKETYGIDGVVTGALYSSYQRDRIERSCDKHGLKIFSPLWHLNQESELREIIDNGFKFIVTKIAADGLDKSWLGKEITHKDIDKLVQLNKRIGINIAFEGGEAETLMVDGPIFKTKIIIKEAEKVMENNYIGLFRIIKAELQER
jgi:asparagine synthase (glutamine-hydrolysing)